MSAERRAITLAYRHCESLTRAAAANFYYGIRLLPAPKRRAMCAVYAFARRVDDIGDGTLAAEEKLRRARWRGSVARLGEPARPAGPDPVMVALADARERFALPLDALGGADRGRRMDVREPPTRVSRSSSSTAGASRARSDGCASRSSAARAERAGGQPRDGGTARGRPRRGDADHEHRARPARGRRARPGVPAGEGSRALPPARRAAARRAGAGWRSRAQARVAEPAVVAGIGGGDVGQLYALMRFQCLRARDWFHRGLRAGGAAGPAQRGLRAGDGGHLPACAAPHRGAPRRGAARSGCRCRCARRRGSPARRCSGRDPGAPPGRTPAGGSVSARVVGCSAAAWRVSRPRSTARAAGARVTLVEVRPRLGGAAYSFEREGLRIDNGQHVFLRCCTRLPRAAGADSAASGGVYVQPRLEIPVLSPGRPAALLRALGAAGAAASGGRARALPASDDSPAPARGARGAGAGAPGPGALRALDERDLGRVAGRARPGPARRSAALWDLIALPTLNLPAAQASLALGAFVFRKGLLERADAGDIGFHRRPLSEIVGEPAERALRAAGVEVRLGWRARAALAARPRHGAAEAARRRSSELGQHGAECDRREGSERRGGRSWRCRTRARRRCSSRSTARRRRVRGRCATRRS